MSSTLHESDERPESPDRFRLLLVALLLLTLVFPHAERLAPDLALMVFFRLAVLLAALRALSDHRAVFWTLTALTLFSLGVEALSQYGGDWLELTSLGATLIFFLIAIPQLVIAVFHRPGVSHDTLYGSACTYLMLILAFGTAFHALQLIDPSSFHMPPWIGDESLDRSFFYFSAVTMTTLGYGDILPVSEAARSLAILESVLGVLYPSILIARLVALYTSGDQSVPFDRPRMIMRTGEGSRFEVLFALQILQILVYPYVSLFWTRMIGVAILLAALSMLSTTRRRLAIGMALGVPTLVYWSPWEPSSTLLVVAALAFQAAFLCFTSFVVLEHVARQREVDREVIFGACSAYLLLGAAFSAGYQLVFALDPDAFSLSNTMTPREIFTSMAYLSYVTLTTLGYGEVLPLDGAAHSLASLESMVGVLFPALLIARLVSLYRLGEEA